jgi:transcriptional regulator with XRE-family HTH domain
MAKRSRSADAIDRHIGFRMKSRREALGMSQHQLGDAIGVTFQKVSKYESGTDRIGAGRLFEAAMALNVISQYFFEGLTVDGGDPVKPNIVVTPSVGQRQV